MFIWLSLLLTGFFALLLLKGFGLLESKRQFIVSAILIAAAMAIRGALFFYRSDDYLDFLSQWVGYFRDNGGFSALGSYFGNYNPPYMYLLALFSYLKVDDLYLIKLCSVVFDVLLAWVCMKTVSLFSVKRSRLLGCFFAVLYLPTVMINGAYWAQCDSIYTFFGIWSIYLVLTDKPVPSMLALAASLAFKLQAVFIMPVFFVLLLAGKIKLRHIFIFPAAYVLYLLPAVFAGKPFFATLTLYVSQAGTVGDALNYNAPSLTSMMYDVADTSGVSAKLVIAAFGFVALTYAYAFLHRRSLNRRAILAFSVLLAVGIPYLLPHMHDRYFYPAELLALTAAFVSPGLLPMPALLELASLHCYLAYFSRRYFVHPRIGGIMVLISLAFAFVYTILSCRNKKNKNFDFSS